MENVPEDWVFRHTVMPAAPEPPLQTGEPISLAELLQRRRAEAAITRARVIHIQKRFRGFLARMRYKKIQQRKGELLYRSTKRVEVSRRLTQYYRVELNKHVEARAENGAPSDWHYALVAK